MQHILEAKVGFEKDQVLLIRGTDLLGDKVKTFKEELLRVKDVKSVTIGDYLPVAGTKRNGNGFTNAGKSKVDHSIGGQFWLVDHDYGETLGLNLIKGRYFSRDIASGLRCRCHQPADGERTQSSSRSNREADRKL